MTDLIVADCDRARLRALIANNHYSGTCSAITVGYGIWHKGSLAGGIVFSTGAGRFANTYCRVCAPIEVVELTRLWLADDMPGNSESRVIGIALRALKKGRGRFRAVLSYADEFSGHVGTIYQATNWYYMGATTTNNRIQIGDKIVHHRGLTNRYGVRSIEKLRQVMGRTDIDYVRSEACKHAYVYPLEPEAEAYCKANCKPYPKRPKQAMAGAQLAQRWGSANLDAPLTDATGT
jgi:hypothetical protein